MTIFKFIIGGSVGLLPDNLPIPKNSHRTDVVNRPSAGHDLRLYGGQSPRRQNPSHVIFQTRLRSIVVAWSQVFLLYQ